MPQPHLRAADTDRAAMATLLGEHMAAGRLTVAEYEDRLGRAYAAKTYAELDELTTDLPPLQAARPAEPRPAVHHSHGPGPWAWAACGWGGGTHRSAWAHWLATSVIVVTIWLATSMVAGLQYPWPVWVIGPWAAMLLMQSLGQGASRAGARRRLH